MTPEQMAMLFFCTFVNVFFLGLQSRNVQGGRYLAAVVTSVGISAANFVFIHFAAQGSWSAFTVSAIGGSLGIAGSIWFYSNVMTKKSEPKAADTTVSTLSIKLDVDTAEAWKELEELQKMVDRLQIRMAKIRAQNLELVPIDE